MVDAYEWSSRSVVIMQPLLSLNNEISNALIFGNTRFGRTERGVAECKAFGEKLKMKNEFLVRKNDS